MHADTKCHVFFFSSLLLFWLFQKENDDGDNNNDDDDDDSYLRFVCEKLPRDTEIFFALLISIFLHFIKKKIYKFFLLLLYFNRLQMKIKIEKWKKKRNKTNNSLEKNKKKKKKDEATYRLIVWSKTLLLIW
jgi:hypothetical protein